MVLINDKLLFLDDVRNPSEAFEYTQQPIFLNYEWEIVRNYEEFVQWITLNGLPKFISFDHDLADSHYTPFYLWNDYEKSKEYQEAQVHPEKTGYECAKWLVEYCIDNRLCCPEFFCHSMNPVGKDKINSLLNQFIKS